MAVDSPPLTQGDSDEVALTFPLVPRDYQREGIEALITHKRYLLADPPSAGKTLQASEAARAVAQKQILVIVGRKYLGPQWRDFLTQQYPNDTINLAKGSILQQAQAIARPAKWVIVNIEMLRTWTIPPELFDCIIIDESHHVRKSTSLQSKATFKLVNSTQPQPIPYVFMLTATPIFKEADDLYMQLHILDPIQFPSYYGFIDRFCAIAMADYGSIQGNTRNSSNVDLLQRILSSYGMIRSWQDLKQQLPAMPSQVHYIDLEAKRKRIYAELRDTWRSTTQDGETLTASSALQAAQELRHITASDTKIEAVQSIIEDNQLPTIVFTWYRDSAHLLGHALKCPVITGSLSDKARYTISSPQANNSTIVATIASINEGVDLSHYHQVIFFEEDYCPGNVFQALSRVRRLNANHPVNLHYVLCRNTIDTVIHRKVRRRDVDIQSITKAALLQHDSETEHEIA